MTHTELLAIVRKNGQVIHWRLLPDIRPDIIGRPDIHLRGANKLVLNRQLMLFNKRLTFRFILTRPVLDVDLSELSLSLGMVYTHQLHSAGNMGKFYHICEHVCFFFTLTLATIAYAVKTKVKVWQTFGVAFHLLVYLSTAKR